MNSPLNDAYQDMAANAICHAAAMAQASIQEAAWEFARPCVIFKPVLSKDGDEWCALFGRDLQEGVAGFGKSPSEAMYAFDQEWRKSIVQELK